jgi:F-type H+-transporting ATPase subunit gamma
MATLRDIRKHLHSVKNIQQLTKAMEMVAASRLHHTQIKTRQSIFYLSKIKEVIDHLNSSLTDFTHPLLQQREVKKTGLVIVGADMGLSGSYNQDVFKAANQFLKKQGHKPTELILIGRKAVDHYQNKQWPVRHKALHMKDTLTAAEIQKLTNRLVDWFLTGELDDVWVVYTHYINIMSRKTITEKFLNIEKPKVQQEQLDYIFEPAPAKIYSEVLFRYCFAKVQALLYESYSSELAARVFAMKKATKNAEEMIEKLTLERNKVRQAYITKEMLEITSGAEGLK